MSKKCNTCGTELMAFKGHWLHVDKPCSGITDAVQIDMTIADEGLQEAFEKVYGKPEKDDYDMRIIAEDKAEDLGIKLIRLESIIEGNWLLRNLMKVIK